MPIPYRKPIAAISGASSHIIQELIRAFALRLATDGFRVVGVTEDLIPTPVNAKRRLALHEIGTGIQYSISQDLGEGSMACNLDVSGLAEACNAIETASASSADLVILSKFGKQEAVGGGFRGAFLRAISEGTPVLTAVNPQLMPAWQTFVGDLGECLPADAAAVEDWWRAIHHRRFEPALAGQF